MHRAIDLTDGVGHRSPAGHDEHPPAPGRFGRGCHDPVQRRWVSQQAAAYLDHDVHNRGVGGSRVGGRRAHGPATGQQERDRGRWRDWAASVPNSSARYSTSRPTVRAAAAPRNAPSPVTTAVRTTGARPAHPDDGLGDARHLGARQRVGNLRDATSSTSSGSAQITRRSRSPAEADRCRGRLASAPCSRQAPNPCATRARRRPARTFPPKRRACGPSPRCGWRWPRWASAARRCRPAPPTPDERDRSTRSATTWPATIGITSVVVVPMSSEDRVGMPGCDRSGRRRPVGSRHGHGLFAGLVGLRKRPSTAYTRTSPDGNARATASSTKLTPSRLDRNICDSSAVIVTAWRTAAAWLGRAGRHAACSSCSTTASDSGRALQLEGAAPRRHDVAVHDQRGLRVHAADVPAQNHVHPFTDRQGPVRLARMDASRARNRRPGFQRRPRRARARRCPGALRPRAVAGGRIVKPGDARAIARWYLETLGLQEMYIADLDALRGRPPQRPLTKSCRRLGPRSGWMRRLHRWPRRATRWTMGSPAWWWDWRRCPPSPSSRICDAVARQHGVQPGSSPRRACRPARSPVSGPDGGTTGGGGGRSRGQCGHRAGPGARRHAPGRGRGRCCGAFERPCRTRNWWWREACAGCRTWLRRPRRAATPPSWPPRSTTAGFVASDIETEPSA